MKRYILAVIGLILASVCITVILFAGKTYTVKTDKKFSNADIEDISVEVENDGVALTGTRLEDGYLYLTFRSQHTGKTYVTVKSAEYATMFGLYVHRSGVITYDSSLGDCTCGKIIPVCCLIYIIFLIVYVTVRYINGIRHDLYDYKNVVRLGLILFLFSLLPGQIMSFSGRSGVIRAVETALHSASFFSHIMLPVAIVISLMITVSNIQLMRKEGKSVRNMLGCILGIMLCVFTLLPDILGEILQRTDLVDVHNQRGAALYVEIMLENTVVTVVTYLECILIGTIAVAVRAARHIPSFDKDYIIIHGCQINGDGTLTPLLKGRADRAVEFARMQKEKTGKDIVFIPSGGKGPDEVISEADAIRDYLIGTGVPEENIIKEDRSENTEQNFRYSAEIIKNGGKEAPKTAFATTNYHVFRAGILASRQGLRAEGIGSKTKSYFWINAFVREFIATLYTERKTHVKVMITVLLILAALVFATYLSNVL